MNENITFLHVQREIRDDNSDLETSLSTLFERCQRRVL